MFGFDSVLHLTQSVYSHAYRKVSESPVSQYLKCSSYMPCNAVVCGSVLLEGTLHVSP